MTVAVTTAFAILATPSGAQGFTSSDSVIRKIWTQGMDSSRVRELAQPLLDSIGPRLTGTPAQRAAIDWALARYRDWGIPARAEQYGTWKGWQRGPTHVDLIVPRVRTLDATMMAWSPGTKGDVDGEVVFLPDVRTKAAFDAWLPTVRGTFVAISFPQPTCRPDTSWTHWGRAEAVDSLDSARSRAESAWSESVLATALGARELPRALEDAGAVGVLSSRWSEGWGVNKVFNARTGKVPQLDLSCEDYSLLYRLAAHGMHPRIRVNAQARMLGEVPVFNVIAELEGREKPTEYVVLSAHFDSWDGATGATDNGTGTVAMMEAMRILKRVHPSPRRTILVGHWSGEEEGLVGSRAWTADHPEVIAGVQAVFNQDNGTGRIVAVSAQGLPDAAAHFARWMSSIPTELTRDMRLDAPGSPSSGGSDYASFICYGAPSFGLYSADWDYHTYTWHTNRDTFDKISFDDLQRNATLIAMLAYEASEDPARIDRGRRQMDGIGSGAWPQCQIPPRQSSEWTR